MAIAAYFHPRGMTLAQCDEVHRRLAAVGQAEPTGRLHHSCFGDDGDLMVYDVWEAPENFEAFGAALMPILEEIGVDPGEPAVMPIHLLKQTKDA